MKHWKLYCNSRYGKGKATRLGYIRWRLRHKVIRNWPIKGYNLHRMVKDGRRP